MRRLLACLALALPLLPTLAQADPPSIVGKVRGPNDLLIPDFDVDVVGANSPQRVTVAVLDDGVWHTNPNLAPGNYDVTVEAEGFVGKTRRVQVPVPGATAIANFRLDMENPKELQIIRVADAASYLNPQGSAGFAILYAKTGLPPGTLLLNDTLDQELNGFTVDLTGDGGRKAEVNIYYVTDQSIAVQYANVNVTDPNASETQAFTVCRNELCGPPFELEFSSHRPSFFSVTSDGSGGAIVTSQNNVVNLPENPMDPSGGILTAWMNGQASETDDVHFFLGSEALNVPYYGETNGITGFMQANWTATGTCGQPNASTLCVPGRHLLMACNTSSGLPKPLCSNPVHFWVGKSPAEYKDPTGWGPALSDILFGEGILGAEVNIVELDDHLFGANGAAVSKRELLIIDPNLIFIDRNNYVPLPENEWEVSTRQRTPPRNLNFTGNFGWRIESYGQDTASTTTNPNSVFVYSRPPDRSLTGKSGTFEWSGVLDSQEFRLALAHTALREYDMQRIRNEWSQAVQGGTIPTYHQCTEIMRQHLTEDTIAFYGETYDAGELGFSSFSIYAGESGFEDEELIAQRDYALEILRGAFDLDAPHNRTFECGIRNFHSNPGPQFVMGDGGVRLIERKVDFSVFRATRPAGFDEVIDF